MAPAPSAGADEQQHRAPARGTQIVDDVGAVVPSEGARGSRIPPELEELEDELDELDEYEKELEDEDTAEQEGKEIYSGAEI